MNRFICGDVLSELAKLPDDCVDLVFGSPPYEDARTYGIGFTLKGQAWVDWMVKVYIESLRVCKGLVAFVVDGRTRQYSYSGTPILLAADLIRVGITLRKPPIYERDGIPGSGGPDWLKNRYEFIVCATNGGRLPWSNNVACGHPPRCGLGGPMSNRDKHGERLFNKQTRRAQSGKRSDYAPSRPMPALANPGNIIDCGADTHFGKIAHENEAPFPEKLSDFFVRTFCPPAYCHVCGCVVEFYNDETQVSCLQENVHGVSESNRPKKVLLKTLHGNRISDTAWKVPILRKTDTSDKAHEPKQVLQPSMFSAMDRPKSAKQTNVKNGIHSGLETGSSGGGQRQVCDGTSTCDGGSDRTTAAKNRSSSPSKQKEVRQPSREFVSHVCRQAQPTTERAKTCPCCGAIAVYPGIVLDCFAGSGTTGASAVKFGRSCWLIDIRQSQIKLARRRIVEAIRLRG